VRCKDEYAYSSPLFWTAIKVSNLFEYMTVVIKCIKISCSSKSPQTLAILTKENTVDYSVIFGYELSVSWIPLECGKRKKTRPLLPIQLSFDVYILVTCFMVFLEKWIFSVCLKKLSLLVFTPKFNYGAGYDPFLGPVQTPELPVMANIHTYDFCISQFFSLSPLPNSPTWPLLSSVFTTKLCKLFSSLPSIPSI